METRDSGFVARFSQTASRNGEGNQLFREGRASNLTLGHYLGGSPLVGKGGENKTADRKGKW